MLSRGDAASSNRPATAAPPGSPALRADPVLIVGPVSAASGTARPPAPPSRPALTGMQGLLGHRIGATATGKKITSVDGSDGDGEAAKNK